jgi:small conductance mechanosensitive channel
LRYNRLVAGFHSVSAMPTITPEDLQTFLLNAALRIGAALAALLIGRWFAGIARGWVRRAMQATHATASLTEIAVRTSYYGTLFVAIFLALVFLGIPAEVLITVIGVVAIIAAVALRESLRDLAATVIFVIFQPFKMGDRIETNGLVGDVQEILLFNTVLITLDNRKLIVPNGNIQNNNIINYSALDKIRLDLPVQISYSDDVQRAKASLLQLASQDNRVLKDPAAVVDVMQLAESGVSLVLRAYTTPADYWALRPALTEKIKLEFDQQSIRFPFPQLDIHLDK